MTIAAMLTPAGVAWIEFMLEEGNGDVFLMVSPQTLDRSMGVWFGQRRGVMCHVSNGYAVLDRAIVRPSTHDWGSRMPAGERVRLVYVGATRMVRVVWRGRSIDLVALPPHHDIATTRFGIGLNFRNTVRITGSSAGAWWRVRRVCAPRHCVTGRAIACATQLITLSRTWVSSRAHARCARRAGPVQRAQITTSWRGCANTRRSG